MKILFVHNYYQLRGGEDVIVEQDIELLRRNGHIVKLVKFTNDEFSNSALSKVINAVKSIYNSDSFQQLSKELTDFKPDIVHIHNLFYIASPSVIDAVKKGGYPLVMTLHNYRLVCINGLLTRKNSVPCEDCLTSKIPLSGIQHACFRDSKLQSAQLTFITSLHTQAKTWSKVDRYFVLTEFAREKFLQSRLGLKTSQVSVKPNSVPDCGYSSFQDRENYFLYVGRLTNEKGINVLLESAYKKEYPLIIAGDGPLRSAVEKASRDLSHVSYLGPVKQEEVQRLLKKSRALLVPSICYEGLPTTILEAFASGTPVICSNQENLNKIVTHTYNGYLFQWGCSQSLVETIDFVNNKTDCLPLIGINARKTYDQNYREEIIIEKLIDLYREVIKEYKSA